MNKSQLGMRLGRFLLWKFAILDEPFIVRAEGVTFRPDLCIRIFQKCFSERSKLAIIWLYSAGAATPGRQAIRHLSYRKSSIIPPVRIQRPQPIMSMTFT